ncbi:MAG: LysR substrate-binding domain-containing protein [Albidovulum sp.]|nr:LysR substrate-binding domain-containing protein [Albidovulum sp.]MDE0305752.1 LysR substrate-binding domain-containing protein [Albidovulum sp.]MDE0533821.1 LysR substrate-binding domain-containing protein [Albidovulum sp.]
MACRFTLRQLEYFVAVGEASSIALASKGINVSPPSISAAISHLEKEFGIQLFIRRHAQGMELTRGGQRFFRAARQVLDGAGGLQDIANEIAGTTKGTISVGCLVTVAPLLMPALRKSFEREYPGSSVAQYDGHQLDLVAMLERAKVDVVLTYDLEIPAGIDFEPFVDLPPYAVFPAGHPLAERSSVELSDIAPEPMVLLDLPLSREYFLSVFQEKGLRPNVAERAGSVPVMLSLVANGYGYGLLNMRLSAYKAPDGGSLAPVALAGRFRPMVLGLATMRGIAKTKILESFEAHCRRSFADKSNSRISQ